MIFLVIYDTRAGALKELREFSADDRKEASVALRVAQEQYMNQMDDTEIALFEAPSRDTLEQTHSRYFRSIAEIGASIEAGLLGSARSS